MLSLWAQHVGSMSQHSLQVSPLRGRSSGGGTGGAPITDTWGRRNGPAAHNSDGRPLSVVGRHHHRPVVRGHVLRELVAERESWGRAAPDDTKMLD